MDKENSSMDYDYELIDENLFNLKIGLADLEEALQESKNSSPGPDNIPLIFLQKPVPVFKTHLSALPQKLSAQTQQPVYSANK